MRRHWHRVLRHRQTFTIGTSLEFRRTLVKCSCGRAWTLRTGRWL